MYNRRDTTVCEAIHIKFANVMNQFTDCRYYYTSASLDHVTIFVTVKIIASRQNALFMPDFLQVVHLYAMYVKHILC